MRTVHPVLLPAALLLLALALLPARAAADVKRQLYFGEIETRRASLLGGDRFALRLGLHTYQLDGRPSTDPALMAGLSWRGTLAPPVPGDAPGRPFARRWGLDGRISAQLLDAPEGPAGTAFEVAGELFVQREIRWFSRPVGLFAGPSLRYGVRRMDRIRVTDNGAVTKYTTSVTNGTLDRMAGFVAGLEIPVAKRLLVRPEARLGTDPSAWVCLVWLPFSSTGPPAAPAVPAEASAPPAPSAPASPIEPPTESGPAPSPGEDTPPAATTEP